MDDGVGGFRRFAKRQEEPIENTRIEAAERQLAVFGNQFDEGVAEFFLKVKTAAAGEAFGRGAAGAVVGISNLIESAFHGTAGEVIGTHALLGGDAALGFSTYGIGDRKGNGRESGGKPEDGEEGCALR